MNINNGLLGEEMNLAFEKVIMKWKRKCFNYKHTLYYLKLIITKEDIDNAIVLLINEQNCFQEPRR